jgi:prolyl oligopeptidase
MPLTSPRSRRLALPLVLLLVLSPAACKSSSSSAGSQGSARAAGPLAYPETRTVEQVDDYHGVPVADPYRWLEDADSEETRAWVDAQNQVTRAFLAEIPARDAIEAELTRLWNYEKFTTPRREGGRYFF